MNAFDRCLKAYVDCEKVDMQLIERMCRWLLEEWPPEKVENWKKLMIRHQLKG